MKHHVLTLKLQTRSAAMWSAAMIRRLALARCFAPEHDVAIRSKMEPIDSSMWSAAKIRRLVLARCFATDFLVAIRSKMEPIDSSMWSAAKIRRLALARCFAPDFDVAIQSDVERIDSLFPVGRILPGTGKGYLVFGLPADQPVSAIKRKLRGHAPNSDFLPTMPKGMNLFTDYFGWRRYLEQ